MTETSIEPGSPTKPEVKIIPPSQETSEPTKNLVENFDRLFYLMGKVTRAGYLGRSPDNPEGISRPLFSRAKRAELYKKIISTSKKNRRLRETIIEEAHLRDGITEQYLNQGEIVVTLPELGEQKARYINVTPPESLKTEETKSKAPIVMIPGISNDIECVGGIVQEASMLGRRIIVIGYPESFQGKTTNELAEAVREDEGYGPHVEFYKSAINQLMGENGQIELWGYSTGAPIVANILNDPEFQNKTENAVLICPASSVNQSVDSIKLGMLHDIGFIQSLKLFPRLSWTYDNTVKRSKDQKQLRKMIFGSLLKKVTTAYDYWKNAKVLEGGSIVIVSGRNDHVTKSDKVKYQFLQNPQAKLIDLRNGYHVTPGVDAENVIPSIFQAQRSTNSSVRNF